ncbi:hypothetical protein HPB47_017774 [Ixodes persulcatus]|uniref:Uncharacterized protein n=1 Tax=Ixodes persulcatus TaxID=34615 RepID=A0AC60QPF6_IXOPE|nr:hypothetical protein HPB47_017774 [Ixodes persulcatus]
MQIAFSSVLPGRENRFSSFECQRSQSAEIQPLNDRHRDVNCLLQEFCHKKGFVFIGDLAAYTDNTLGLPKLCPRENLGVVNREVLYTFLSHHYVPQRMVVAGVGVEHGPLVEMVHSPRRPSLLRHDPKVVQHRRKQMP